MAKVNDQKQGNGSVLGFEAQLWAATDKMRGHMDDVNRFYICNRFECAPVLHQPV